ncbi:unnamed protein product, partial [Brassica oleracea var. botrytis]
SLSLSTPLVNTLFLLVSVVLLERPFCGWETWNFWLCVTLPLSSDNE